MFKGIDIKLSGPICTCDEQNLSWYVTSSSGLGLKCTKCETELKIPHTKFSARFMLENPYPGKKTEKKKPELKPLDGGKVLDFKTDADKEPA